MNVALAAWLLISAYLWRHNEPQFLVTTLVGAVVAFVAPFDLSEFPVVRRLDTAAGLALALAAFALPHLSLATVVHNVVVGMTIAAVSLVGPHEVTVDGHDVVLAPRHAPLRASRSHLFRA